MLAWVPSFMRFSRVFVPVLLAVCAYAQSAPTTSLSGTIRDASGSVGPSASLDLTSPQTRWTRQARSDSQGRFLFSLVPPGTYDLSAAAQGFTSVLQQGLRLDAD